ncbi:hypothetical protein CE91St43_28000 [Oscillospiraceae bacterium]|nr:hypothetical protein CE91St43_28000 [Oscillospiraceae bacterium]
MVAAAGDGDHAGKRLLVGQLHRGGLAVVVGRGGVHGDVPAQLAVCVVAPGVYLPVGAQHTGGAGPGGKGHGSGAQMPGEGGGILIGDAAAPGQDLAVGGDGQTDGGAEGQLLEGIAGGHGVDQAALGIVSAGIPVHGGKPGLAGAAGAVHPQGVVLAAGPAPGHRTIGQQAGAGVAEGEQHGIARGVGAQDRGDVGARVDPGGPRQIGDAVRAGGLVHLGPAGGGVHGIPHVGVAGADPGGGGAQGAVAGAQLAEVVGTPSPDKAVGVQRQGVVGPGGDGHHILEHPGVPVALGADDLHGHVLVVAGGADAQLAVGVVAPGPDGAVGAQGHGEVVAGDHHGGGVSPGRDLIALGGGVDPDGDAGGQAAHQVGDGDHGHTEGALGGPQGVGAVAVVGDPHDGAVGGDLEVGRAQSTAQAAGGAEQVQARAAAGHQLEGGKVDIIIIAVQVDAQALVHVHLAGVSGGGLIIAVHVGLEGQGAQGGGAVAAHHGGHGDVGDIRGAAHAQLSPVVAAGGEDIAVVAEHDRVAHAAGDGPHVLQVGQRITLGHVVDGGGGLGGGGAVAQLAISVLAPGVHLALAGEGVGEGPAGGHVGDVADGLGGVHGVGGLQNHGGIEAVFRGPVAQAAEVVVAEGVDLALVLPFRAGVFHQHQGMGVAGGHSHRPVVVAEGEHTVGEDLSGHIAVIGGAGAQLAVGAVAPGVHGTARGQGHAVAAARGDLDHLIQVVGGRPALQLALAGGEAVDLDGDGEEGLAAVGGVVAHARLAVLIVAPGPDLALAVQGEGVVVPGGDRHDTGQVLHHFGCADANGVPGAQLAILVIAPGPDETVCVYRQGMHAAGGDILDVAGAARVVQELHLAVGIARVGGPAQDAVGLSAPAVNLAVAGQRQGEVVTGGHHGGHGSAGGGGHGGVGHHADLHPAHLGPAGAQHQIGRTGGPGHGFHLIGGAGVGHGEELGIPALDGHGVAGMIRDGLPAEGVGQIQHVRSPMAHVAQGEALGVLHYPLGHGAQIHVGAVHRDPDGLHGGQAEGGLGQAPLLPAAVVGGKVLAAQFAVVVGPGAVDGAVSHDDHQVAVAGADLGGAGEGAVLIARLGGLAGGHPLMDVGRVGGAHGVPAVGRAGDREEPGGAIHGGDLVDAHVVLVGVSVAVGVPLHHILGSIDPRIHGEVHRGGIEVGVLRGFRGRRGSGGQGAVLAPDPGLAVLIQCQGEVPAGGHGHDTGQRGAVGLEDGDGLLVAGLGHAGGAAVGTAAQLAEGVVAQGPHGAVRLQQDGVALSGGDVDDVVAVADHGSGKEAVLPLVPAVLAMGGGAPDVDGAVHGEGRGMVNVGGDLDHLVHIFVVVHRRHGVPGGDIRAVGGHGDHVVGRIGALGQEAAVGLVLLALGAQGLIGPVAVGVQLEEMVHHHAGGRHHGGVHAQRGVGRAGEHVVGGPAAQFALVVDAPAHYGAVGLQGQHVVVADGDLGHAGEVACGVAAVPHLGGRVDDGPLGGGLAGHGAGSQMVGLQAGVAAPGPDGAVRPQGGGEVVARQDHGHGHGMDGSAGHAVGAQGIGVEVDLDLTQETAVQLHGDVGGGPGGGGALDMGQALHRPVHGQQLLIEAAVDQLVLLLAGQGHPDGLHQHVEGVNVLFQDAVQLDLEALVPIQVEIHLHGIVDHVAAQGGGVQIPGGGGDAGVAHDHVPEDQPVEAALGQGHHDGGGHAHGGDAHRGLGLLDARAQLSLVVAAPGPEGAVGLQDHGGGAGQGQAIGHPAQAGAVLRNAVVDLPHAGVPGIQAVNDVIGGDAGIPVRRLDPAGLDRPAPDVGVAGGGDGGALGAVGGHVDRPLGGSGQAAVSAVVSQELRHNGGGLDRPAGGGGGAVAQLAVGVGARGVDGGGVVGGTGAGGDLAGAQEEQVAAVAGLVVPAGQFHHVPQDEAGLHRVGGGQIRPGGDVAAGQVGAVAHGHGRPLVQAAGVGVHIVLLHRAGAVVDGGVAADGGVVFAVALIGALIHALKVALDPVLVADIHIPVAVHGDGAPGIGGAVGQDRRGIAVAGLHHDGVGQELFGVGGVGLHAGIGIDAPEVHQSAPLHGHGSGVVGLPGGGAHLAVGVVAPGQDGAVGPQGQGVAAAGGDGRHGGLCGGGAVGDGGGIGHIDVQLVGGGAQAQLAPVVAAPGVEGAVGGQRHAEAVARGDVHDVLEVAAAGGIADLDGHILIEGGVGVAVAQLAVAIVAPGPDGAVGLQGQGVLAAVDNLGGGKLLVGVLHDVGLGAHLHPDQAGQLAVVVADNHGDRAEGVGHRDKAPAGIGGVVADGEDALVGGEHGEVVHIRGKQAVVLVAVGLQPVAQAQVEPAGEIPLDPGHGLGHGVIDRDLFLHVGVVPHGRQNANVGCEDVVRHAVAVGVEAISIARADRDGHTAVVEVGTVVAAIGLLHPDIVIIGRRGVHPLGAGLDLDVLDHVAHIDVEDLILHDFERARAKALQARAGEVVAHGVQAGGSLGGAIVFSHGDVAQEEGVHVGRPHPVGGVGGGVLPIAQGADGQAVAGAGLAGAGGVARGPDGAVVPVDGGGIGAHGQEPGALELGAAAGVAGHGLVDVVVVHRRAVVGGLDGLGVVDALALAGHGGGVDGIGRPGAQAQLVLAVVAPGVDMALAVDGKGAVTAGVDPGGGKAIGAVGLHGRDPDGQAGAGQAGVLAQLALAVVAPGVHHARGIHGQEVVGPRGQVHDVLEVMAAAELLAGLHLDGVDAGDARAVAHDAVAGGGPLVVGLARVVHTPDVHRAVAHQGGGGVVAARQLGDLGGHVGGGEGGLRVVGGVAVTHPVSAAGAQDGHGSGLEDVVLGSVGLSYVVPAFSNTGFVDDLSIHTITGAKLVGISTN